MNVTLCRILFFLMLVSLYSCASTKDMVLLQQDPPAGGPVQDQAKSIPIFEKEYKLRPNDRLMLNIFSLTDEKVNFLKEPQVERVVDARGQIELPVIGAVPVAGLSIKQAEDTIRRSTSDYLRSPSVTIKVMNLQVTVLGEVARQGAILLPEPRINLLEALGQAGGLTENANRQTIRIVRNENKAARIYNVNLLDQKSLSSRNFFLEPNDVVLVNPRRAVAMRQERLSTVSLVISLLTGLSFLVVQLVRG